MALIHQVYDTDAHFKIDPITRAIKNSSTGKNVLIQGDHNSERFTFELSKVIDGHDMSKCNSVQVHYINIDSTDKTKISADVHDVDDLQVSPEDENVVICSWLISQNATKYAGSLSFLLKFKCIADDGSVSYVWNTARFDQISVSIGIDNGEAIAEEYSDILAQWEARIATLENSSAVSVTDYYSTTREESEVKYFEDIKTAYIYGLYDALVEKYTDKKIERNKLGEITTKMVDDNGNPVVYPVYEYIVSTGDYSTEGYYCGYGEPDPEIKKPKYLISSGIHGHESVTTLYLYRFIRDVLDGHNVPNSFREGAILHIIPVINPWGLDNYKRRNENDVDININFDWNWDLCDNETKGKGAESEQETQIVANWLRSHTDADLWIDLHNSSLMNEPVSVLGCSNEMVDTAKKIAMRGIDKIIPYWRDVIGYPETALVSEALKDENGKYIKDENNDFVYGEVEKKLIYSYAATLEGFGTHYAYASNVLGINNIMLEIMAYNGNHSDWITDKPISTENVAMGAEILGNALIEFYNESFMNGVVDMTKTNGKIDALAENTNTKLDALLQSASFYTKSDVYSPDTDVPNNTWVTIPCPNGAKVLVLTPTKETYDKLVTYPMPQGPVFLGLVGQAITLLPFMHQFNSDGTPKPDLRYMSYMALVKDYTYNNKTEPIPNYHYTECNNTDGFSVKVTGLKAGDYNWTAYYWND